MTRVTGVKAVLMRSPFPGSPHVFVAATGEVPSTGWSNLMLSPRIHMLIEPPTDGIMELDFVGSPASLGGQVIMPVHASYLGSAPSWLKGVRIEAAENNMKDGVLRALDAEEISPAAALAGEATPIVQKVIAVYDDSFQPIGFCGGFKIKMKKLRHELTLTIAGPDEARIHRCIQDARRAGAVAALIAAFASGGMAAGAAFIKAALAQLTDCLSVRLDDRSRWIEWCT